MEYKLWILCGLLELMEVKKDRESWVLFAMVSAVGIGGINYG